MRARGLIGQQGGHEIIWLSAVKARLPGIESYGFSRYFARKLLAQILLEPLLVWNTLRRVKPDIVHVHYASKGPAALALRSAHKLVVSVMGSDVLPEAGYHGVYAPFTRILLQRADSITSKSGYMDEAVLAIGNFGKKLRRITWGVDLELFRPGRETHLLRKRLEIPEGARVFFDPRNARPLYNKRVILEAFSRYQAQAGPSAVLLSATINAEPDYLAELKSRAIRLSIAENVRFLEPQMQEEMADLYCLSDACVSLPRSDGLPQSMLEAMACGTYLILGNLPQYAEVVKEIEGYRSVEVKNPQEIADAMHWVANNPEAAAGIAAGNRNYVEVHADQREENKKVLAIYAQLLERGAQP